MEVRPLSLWERVGVRGYSISIGRNPSPGSLRDPTSPHGRGGPCLRRAPNSTTLLNNLEQTRRAHAAADAHGDDRVLRLAATALDQGVAGETGAGHAVGVADRN